MKNKETLEEVAAEFAKNHSIYPTAQDDTEYVFINGAKWQQERMYSEEDLKYAFDSGRVRLTFDKERPFVFKNKSPNGALTFSQGGFDGDIFSGLLTFSGCLMFLISFIFR